MHRRRGTQSQTLLQEHFGLRVVHHNRHPDVLQGQPHDVSTGNIFRFWA